MIIHPHNSSSRELTLERKDLASCPLGTVGNLQFNAEQGGTAPARRVGVLLSGMRRSQADRGANLKAYFTGESSQARARRRDLIQAHKNSRLIGDLLGRLTAPAHDCKSQARIANVLIELVRPCKFDDLKGGQQALDRYVKNLSERDLQALANGLLCCYSDKEAVLAQILRSFGSELGGRASEVLDRIERSMRDQLNEFRDDSLSSLVTSHLHPNESQ